MGVCVVVVMGGRRMRGKGDGMKHVVKECIKRKGVYEDGEEAR